MSLDLTLLKLLKHRENYEKYARAIPEGAIEPHTKVLLKDLGMFFKENSDCNLANVDDFASYFKLAHPKLKAESSAVLVGMIRAAAPDVPPEVAGGLVSRLTSARAAIDMASALEQWNNGDEFDLMRTLRLIADRAPVGQNKMPIVEYDIDAMLLDEENDWGFSWRLNCMNQSMRPLRPGDFGIVAARVDQGKTTWFASELTHMAQQVDVLFPDQNRSIIYLNNEGVGKRIIQRCYQAALNATVTDLVELSKKGTIRADYLKALGGREVIRVLDVHDHPLSSLEDMVARMNPALVVVDMLDVVPFDGSANNGGTRTDQLLEAAYQRARFWAVKYDCAVIAASQLSAEADGNLYPPLASLANSKTGKPGAADWVAMLGASNDPLMRESRWVSLPKNKLARSGFPKDPRSEVIFKGDTARVENPL